ncbi:hypothetical protein JCM4814A_61880 [Streptomyces phaeofaciens JCM 4814]|uniref:Uncharacterized protein n=1 Tax=Streptomyces phaeofaciens TaxID=68254 RepID=A0A918LYR9_9ACTN|nr:hypothetical protein GCM10010226_56930 [Streptomyces phaeofaciens]
MTVLVSSDTDIYISPGLYGDCLPTVATDGAADSFRAGHFSFACLFMLAHRRRSEQRPSGSAEAPFRDSCHIDAMTIVKVT